MKTQTFVRRLKVPAPAETLFAWHEAPGAFQRLTPSWEPVRVLEQTGGIRDGASALLQIGLPGPFGIRWQVVHQDYIAGRQFVDRQVRGPIAFWKHTHAIEPSGPTESYLEDRIEYALPLGRVGNWVAGAFVRRKLERLFNYRHAITFHDLTAIEQYRSAGAMKVLVSGSTGLVGSELCTVLTSGGHEIARLVRESPRSRQPEVTWDPAKGQLNAAQLEGFDAVVHLAGENISSRWTEKQKARIRDSRIQGTQLLCETLAKLKQKPQTLVCASAIGFYGDRGNQELDESSPPGNPQAFLVDVCKQWEAATEPARAAGIRVVNLRFGVILSPKGGALAKMLLPFQLGAGGIIGDGKQFMSWIALDDAVGAIQHVLATSALTGPVNAVSPQSVTNYEFTKTLGTVLYRPTIFPVPAFAARLAFGEMADELLLASTRVKPAQLNASGYKFRYPQLEAALRHVLGK
jgi:uncharacterized protein (TIGR01777 family)